MGLVSIVLGGRVATFAVVAVSGRFVVKCACTVSGRDEDCPTAVKTQHGWETGVVFVFLCIFRVELFTRRISHYPWMSFQSWSDLVRFDSSDDVVVRFDSSDDVFLVTIGAASWHL